MQTVNDVLDNTIEVRKGSDRGTFTNHWLHARFSFSFGAWQQRGREGFGPLRALNEDIVQPDAGFDMHLHRDLDIFVMPLSGVVEHRDSLGNLAQSRPGQVQRTFAASGRVSLRSFANQGMSDHWPSTSSRSGPMAPRAARMNGPS